MGPFLLGESVSRVVIPNERLSLFHITVAPSLVKNGLAFGLSISDEYPLVTYQALSFDDPTLYTTQPSPRYWLLWPGVLVMMVYSFADVILTMAPLLLSK